MNIMADWSNDSYKDEDCFSFLTGKSLFLSIHPQKTQIMRLKYALFAIHCYNALDISVSPLVYSCSHYYY